MPNQRLERMRITLPVDYQYGDMGTLSTWEIRTGHRQMACRGGECTGGCTYCELSVCSICRGGEGSLLPYCPGRELPYAEDCANYDMYCRSIGPFARATQSTVLNAYTAVCDLTRGERSNLRDALLELLNHLVEVDNAA